MRASGRAGEKSGKAASYAHISGAEGIYERELIPEVTEEYIKRAMYHPRGKPDRIEIAIDRISTKPKKIRSLPIKTVCCRSVRAARGHIRRILSGAGLSPAAIDEALEAVYNENAMRGASLICSASGLRAEPDKERGVRASRLGISHAAADILVRELARGGINSGTVREAVVLASKVASCKHVIAELCVSDDPDYTTGYVASGKCGYIRIPRIKKKGDRAGGRVFFIKDDACLKDIISYLEKTPVLVDEVSPYFGVVALDEVIGSCHI
jgi:6-carboxyhexanoate--CoA ligase